MRAFDLDEARQAIREGRLQDWQLLAGVELFERSGNPRGSVLESLVRLGHLEPVEAHALLERAQSRAAESAGTAKQARPATEQLRVEGSAKPPPSPSTEVLPVDARAPNDSKDTQAKRATLDPNGSFGPYLLRGLVGRGGMGSVYRAYRADLNRFVALKILDENSETAGQRRFLQEARTAAKLSHPNIVRVYDVGKVGDSCYFTMDLIDGESLDERIQRQGPLPIDEGIRIVCRIADALELAHKHGVVHRDLKPANVLLSRDHDEPYLTDFGLARSVETIERLTRTGFAVGTPSYMSPEQARGARDVDGRADVYGLGSLLFSALSGRVPFEGANATETMQKVLRDAPPSLRAARPDASRALERAYQRAVVKRRDQRWPSARSFAAALEEANPEAATASPGGARWAVMLMILIAAGYGAQLALESRRMERRYQDQLRRIGERLADGDLSHCERLLAQAREQRPEEPGLQKLDARLEQAWSQRHSKQRAERERAEARAQRRVSAQQQRLTAALEQARDALRDGRPEQALAALATIPEEAKALRDPGAIRAEALRALGDDRAASTVLEALRRDYPNDLRIAWPWARVSAVLSEPKDLASHLISWSKQTPSLELELIKSEALRQQGHWNAALELLDRVSSEAPARLDIRFARLELLNELDRSQEAYEEASSLISENLSTIDRAMATLHRAEAGLDSDDSERFESARADCVIAGQLLAGVPTRLPMVLRQTLRSGDLPAARKIVELIERGLPASAEALAARGLWLIQVAHKEHRGQRQRPAAAGYQLLREAHDQGVKKPALALDISEAQALLEEPDEALKWARQAAIATPDSPRAIATLFGLSRWLNDLDEAARFGQKLVAACPKELTIRQEVIDVMIASGRAKAGAELAERSLLDWPGDLPLRYRKARALRALNPEDQQSAQALRDALEVTGPTLDSLSTALSELLQFPEAPREISELVARILKATLSAETAPQLSQIAQQLDRHARFAEAGSCAERAASHGLLWLDNEVVRARALIAADRLDEARALLQPNLERPRSDRIHHCLGLLELLAGRHRAAAKLLAEVHYKPKRLLSLCFMAMAARQLGHDALAEARRQAKPDEERLAALGHPFAPLLAFALGKLDRQRLSSQDLPAMPPRLTAERALVLAFALALDGARDAATVSLAALVVEAELDPAEHLFAVKLLRSLRP